MLLLLRYFKVVFRVGAHTMFVLKSLLQGKQDEVYLLLLGNNNKVAEERWCSICLFQSSWVNRETKRRGYKAVLELKTTPLISRLDSFSFVSKKGVLREAALTISPF